MKIKSLVISVILLRISLLLSAQYYNTGQDPAGLKWLQIKTGSFRIIFPEEYNAAGMEFARVLENAHNTMSYPGVAGRYRLPVIIHNYTTQSNGYVAWAPRRMEIYPTPEQNSIPLDHNSQLAYHELTHVYQMESFSRGFSRTMSIFFGQQFPGVVASLVPQWFLEGDAVFNESFFTLSGRGRTASFQKYLKAISIEKGKMYKYDQLVNGSYKHFIPDHYQTGYQIVAWSKLSYDQDIWDRAVRLTANAPYLVNPVNLSLRQNIGKTKKTLAEETFDTLSVIWRNETETHKHGKYEIINPPKGNKYINYYSPVRIAENTYAAVRTSLAEPPAIVIVNSRDRTEKKIHLPGSMYPYVISSGGGILAWVETRPDPRWDNRNYSVIRLMDTRDGTIRQLSRKTRYMSAAISPDAEIIAAGENTPDNKNNLVLINSRSGKIIKSVPVPGNAYPQKLRWSEDGGRISMISLTSGGEGIISFSMPDMTWKQLIPESPTDYQSATIRNDSLFYVSSESGTENVYVLTPDKKNIRITSAFYGATDPLPDGKKIIFSNYSTEGNNLCVSEIDVGQEIDYERNTRPDTDSGPGAGSAFLIDRINTPGERPETYGEGPDTTEQKSEAPGERPEKYVDRPVTTEQKSEAPGERPEKYGDRPRTTGQKSEGHGERSGTNGNRPDTTGQESEVPGKRIKTPGERPETNGDRPDTTGQKSEASGKGPEPKKYVTEKYRKWQHLFNIHSWMPFYADIDEIKSDPLSVRPGFTVFSQNHLSTLTTSAGYEYSDGLHKFHSGIRWEGWYPVYDAGIHYGDDPVILRANSDDPEPLSPNRGIYITNSLSLPLRFSSGKYHQFLQPSLSFSYRNNYIFVKEDASYDYGQTMAAARIYFYNARKSSMRDIHPVYAQVIDIHYSSYPRDRNFYGPVASVQTAFFFPGIFPNNSLRIRLEGEQQKAAEFLRTNRLHFPRGYRNIISEKIFFASGDYKAPLAYPDLSIGSLLYLKRLRAGIFYDFARGNNNYYLRYGSSGRLSVDHVHNYAESFKSFGGELITDFHVLRLPYMISAGVQAAWSGDFASPVLKAIFSMDIYGMSIGRSGFERSRL